MNVSAILSQLNLISQCRKYQLPVWQCPQFVFLIMGLIIVGSTLLTYFISIKFVADPLIVSIIVILLTTLLLILDFIITRSFERLAEVAQMRANFISIVSHQLRAPLSNFKWAIEAVMPRNLEKTQEKRLEYLEILKENADRMTDLVSDLLTVSRIEEGRLPLKKEGFALSKIVKETIKHFAPFARARNVKIELTGPEKLPLAWADPQQIRQVIENLLDNAIQYTPAMLGKKGKAGKKEKGKVKIIISQQNKKILFQIEDTGMGISQREQKYVFKKFFRAENAKRWQAQGSGLGLFIAKSIIERAGGKIGFKSQENQGSTFWFTLPIKI